MKQADFLRRVASISFYCRFVSLFLACVLWPHLSFADDLMGGIKDDDYSIRFLSNIFGVVDGVLHGSGSQIFGAMFSVFNSAVLTLGTTILGYTLFVSTLRTAHEGEALGRNWSSMWIPFKSATGFALMLPKASGYSMIQIFTMWVVVQGVGAANLVWGAALDYLNSGGAIIQPNTPSLKGSVEMGGKVLKSEVCMFMIEQGIAEDQKAAKETDPTLTLAPIPSFADSVTTPTATNQPNFTGASPTIIFPGKLTNTDGSSYRGGQYDGVCGTLKWSASSETPEGKQLGDARSLAALQVITDLIPYAQQIAKDYGPPYPSETNHLPPKESILNSKTGAMSKTVLRDAGNDYEGIVGPAVNLLRSASSVDVEGIKKYGWIMAGSYYQQIISLNRNYATEEKSYPTIDNFDYLKIKNLPESMAPYTGTVENPGKLAKFFGADRSTSDLEDYIQSQVDNAGSSIGAKKAAAILGYDSTMGGGLGQAFSIISGGLSSIIQGYAELWGNTGDETSTYNAMNPVTSAAILGSGLVSLVGTLWISGMVTAFTLTALGYICSAVNPIGYAISTSITWLIPMLTVLMVTMFILGATLAYYIPLVPYILFLFGGLGWIIGVIESIAAAPLVALGIAYPEEHEILGKAQPAVMLLANIFIRPSLMVIGFIAGISLSYVGIWLLNAGFARASEALTAGTQGWAWLFMPLAMMSIYTALVVQIINQSFSLIHLIPDEVLRWVGGGGKQFGEGQGEQAVRGAFKEDMSAFGKGAANKEKDDAKPSDAGGEQGNKSNSTSVTPTSTPPRGGTQ